MRLLTLLLLLYTVYCSVVEINFGSSGLLDGSHTSSGVPLGTYMAGVPYTSTLLVGGNGYRVFSINASTNEFNPTVFPNNDASLYGQTGSDNLGTIIANLGDMDADGVDDYAVGNPQANSVYIGMMNTDGTAKAWYKLSTPTLPPTALFGQCITSIGDLDQDGNIDILVGAPGELLGSGTVYIGFLEANLSVKSWVPINTNTNTYLLAKLHSNDNFGWSCASIGDTDGDGAHEVVIGAPKYDDDDPSSDFGAVLIAHLGSSATVNSWLLLTHSKDPFLSSNLFTYDYFGTSIAGVGDVDNDGHIDFAVGAPGYYDRSVVTGGVFLAFTGPAGVIKSWKLYTRASEPFFAANVVKYDALGSSLAWVGQSEDTTTLAVGAPNKIGMPAASSSIYLMTINTAGSATNIRKINFNNMPEFQRPWSILDGEFASSGDLYLSQYGSVHKIANNEDVIMGRASTSKYGTSMALFGENCVIVGVPLGYGYVNIGCNNTGSITWKTYSTGTNTFLRANLVATSQFGQSIAVIGDVDHDGVEDVLIGAPGENSSKGAAYIAFMKSDGLIKSWYKFDTTSAVWASSFTAGDKFGYGVSNLGDLDGDNTTDIVIGAPGTNSNRGALYVVYLNANGSPKSWTRLNEASDVLLETTTASESLFGSAITKIFDRIIAIRSEASILMCKFNEDGSRFWTNLALKDHPEYFGWKSSITARLGYPMLAPLAGMYAGLVVGLERSDTLFYISRVNAPCQCNENEYLVMCNQTATICMPCSKDACVTGQYYDAPRCAGSENGCVSCATVTCSAGQYFHEYACTGTCNGCMDVPPLSCPILLNQPSVVAITCPSNTSGSVCSPLQCALGYSGAPTSCICQAVGDVGVWTNSTGCSLIESYCPGQVVQPEITTSACTLTKLGDSCTPSACAAGYIGTPTPCTCTASGDVGVWTPSIGCSLNLNYCPAPVQDGYEFTDCVASLNSNCQASCAAAYKGTPTAISCQANGQWSAATGCLPINYCPAQVVQDGVPVTDCADRSLGAECLAAACDAGYIGTPVAVICTHLTEQVGSWSTINGCTLAPGTCIPKPTQEGYHYEANCNNTVGSYCIGSCAGGYTGTATSSVCLANYTWSLTTGCAIIENYCPEKPIQPGYYYDTNCVDRKVSGECAGVCDETSGYIGTPSAAICGNDGQWTYASGCTSLVTFCAAKPVQPGYKYEADCGNRVIGATCTGICDSGFLGVPTAATCGADGQWSVTTGCDVIKYFCPAKPVQKGYYYSAECPDRKVDGYCTAGACQQGYTGTPTASVCGTNGTWSNATGCTANAVHCNMSYCADGTYFNESKCTPSFDGCMPCSEVVCQFGKYFDGTLCFDTNNGCVDYDAPPTPDATTDDGSSKDGPNYLLGGVLAGLAAAAAIGSYAVYRAKRKTPTPAPAAPVNEVAAAEPPASNNELEMNPLQTTGSE